jgi:hypothetical protein
LTLVRTFTPESMRLARNKASAAAWSLQTVYDLAAKSRVGLRFNCKNLTSKCASLRFNCNRQRLPVRVIWLTIAIYYASAEPYQLSCVFFLVRYFARCSHESDHEHIAHALKKSPRLVGSARWMRGRRLRRGADSDSQARAFAFEWR